MKNYLLLCLLLVSSSLLSSCARVSSDFSTRVNPKYKFAYQIKRFVILSNNLSLKEQILLEKTFNQMLKDYDVSVVDGFELYSLNESDGYKFLQKKRIDTLVSFDIKNRDISKKHVPLYMPGRATTNIHGSSITTYYTRSYDAGYTVSRPLLTATIIVADIKNLKEPVLLGEVDSRGNGLSSFSDLIVDIVKKTVLSFEKEGFITRKIKQTKESVKD